RIWHAYMQLALEGVPSVAFPRPDSSEIPRGRYIRDSGRSSTYSTTKTTYRYGRPTVTSKRKTSSTSPPITVSSGTGAPGKKH
ncbi:MAG: hypothetical protein QOG03_1971, partial [Actinomycetota bacterium]|nr:hypothetical protein [Actinomycetota bacterium]